MGDIRDLNRRLGELRTERSSWWQHWQELSQNLLPVNGRFFVTDRNRGLKRYNSIYDSTGGDAVNVLVAGMMSGMTSPSRPWFSLTLADRDVMKVQSVKVWLNQVTGTIQEVFAKSNVYRALHGIYEELAVFGTASSFMADDYKNIIHMQSFTIGEYSIDTDWKGDVVTLYREFQKTVGAIVKEFGYTNCSPNVQALFDKGALGAWITIVHAIEPRADRDREYGKPGSKNMPWKSCYFERDIQDKYLRESGFKSYPCVSPRWKITGTDVYGTSPGMYALGDVKALQTGEFRKMQAIDYKANPPLQVPSYLKNRELEIFPGGINYYDASSAVQGIKTAFEVQLDIRELLMSQQDIRHRINSAFFKDIFLMISSQPANGQMTATEVAARNEEKMLMLGPVIERLSNELLDPLVETVFERLLTGGLLPPPPQELQGHDLNVEYTSILAQAQKSISVAGIDRFVTNMGQLATIKPNVLDNFDEDKWAEIYSDKLGVDPELMIAGEQVALIRQQRSQAQAQQQKQEAILQASQAAHNLGNISSTPGNLVSDTIQKIQTR